MCNVFMCVTKHLWAISSIHPVGVQGFNASLDLHQLLFRVLDAGARSISSD